MHLIRACNDSLCCFLSQAAEVTSLLPEKKTQLHRRTRGKCKESFWLPFLQGSSQQGLKSLPARLLGQLCAESAVLSCITELTGKEQALAQTDP